MDRRRLLLILAVFVAIIGTALVFLYVQGADKRAQDKYSDAQAYVAMQNISAGETFDQALASGKIAMHSVPQNVLDENTGYQTSDATLKGTMAVAPILQGQVIVDAQWGDAVTTATSNLALPPGDMAISVNLTDPDRVAGNIQNGSTVAIFVTGTLQAAGAATGAAGPNTETTRLLLPKVLVLNVGSPQPPTTSTSTDQNGTQTTEQLPRTLLTLAVTQKEAQKVILASKALDLTFGLLNPNSKVKPAPGTSTLDTSLFAK
jgi:pilus assembly protein CpaB